MPHLSASHIAVAKNQFRQVLGREQIESVARRTGFVQRSRLVRGGAVFWAFMLTLGAQGLQYITDVQRTLNSREGWKLRYKPFWNRLSKDAFPRFMRAMYELICRELACSVLQAEVETDSDFFSEILVDDGSTLTVADGLKKVFPSRCTKGRPAAVELHAQLDVLRDQFTRVTIAPDKEAERPFLPSADSLPPRSLSLRDRGYIDLSYFEALEDRRNGPAYLICRAYSESNPQVDKIRDVPRNFAKKWEGKKLQMLPKSFLRKGADLDVSWKQPGPRTLRLRLVVRFRQPRRFNKRRHGKVKLTRLERRYEKKNQWAFLLSNVPTCISADAIARLYLLRWQVELAFKELKSYANLRALQSERAAIVEGFIWASLAAALLKRALAHLTQRIHNCPISVRIAAQSGPLFLPRFVDWITREPDDSAFDEVLAFLLNNSQRAHPKRDERRAQRRLGLVWVTQAEPT